jgi:hypothetical protein
VPKKISLFPLSTKAILSILTSHIAMTAARPLSNISDEQIGVRGHHDEYAKAANNNAENMCSVCVELFLLLGTKSLGLGS